MKHVSLGQARDRLSALVNDAAHGGQRIVLSSRGRPKAALIGMEDLEWLERAEAEPRTIAREMLRWIERVEDTLRGRPREEILDRSTARGTGGGTCRREWFASTQASHSSCSSSRTIARRPGRWRRSLPRSRYQARVQEEGHGPSEFQATKAGVSRIEQIVRLFRYDATRHGQGQSPAGREPLIANPLRHLQPSRRAPVSRQPDGRQAIDELVVDVEREGHQARESPPDVDVHEYLQNRE